MPQTRTRVFRSTRMAMEGLFYRAPNNLPPPRGKYLEEEMGANTRAKQSSPTCGGSTAKRGWGRTRGPKNLPRPGGSTSKRGWGRTRGPQNLPPPRGKYLGGGEYAGQTHSTNSQLYFK